LKITLGGENSNTVFLNDVEVFEVLDKVIISPCRPILISEQKNEEISFRTVCQSASTRMLSCTDDCITQYFKNILELQESFTE